MKTAGFDARALANELLNLADSRSITLTNLHLQKVVFFSHAEFLHKTGLNLVCNRFEAWEHGPVVPELYHALKEFGENPVNGRAKNYDFVSKAYVEVVDQFAPSTSAFLETMLLYYGKMDAWQLVKLSHARGGPWWMTIEQSKQKANFGLVIDSQLIRDCFHAPDSGITKH